MDRWRGKVAVITGASAGIGLATAKALLKRGMKVVGLARRRNKMMEEMRNAENLENFLALECDVGDENSVAEAFDHIEKRLETVSVLINNAGALLMSTVEDATIEDLQSIVNVNLMGVVYCYKRAVKLMKAKGEEGYVINLNSIAGHKMPQFPSSSTSTTKATTKKRSLNVYGPTKFALTALSEVLTRELQGGKIRVTNLSPGYVKTDIMSARGLEGLNIPDDMPGLNAEDIAEAIVYLIGTPMHVQIAQFTIQPFGAVY